MKVNFEQFCKIVSELNLNCDKKNNGNIESKIYNICIEHYPVIEMIVLTN